MNLSIVITGCSSGFGKLAAERLAQMGNRVYATMRDPEGKNAKNADELRLFAEKHDADLRILSLDVTSTDSVNAAANKIQGEVDTLDVVINNAGQMYVGVAECFDENELSRQLDINIVGVHRMHRAFLPMMRLQRSGLVINISSIAGRIATPFFAVYHASKWGLEGYCQAMRGELASSGVDMVLIEPGPFTTELFSTSPAPADQEGRIQTYPPVVPETFEQQNASFRAMFENPDVPTDPNIVVDRMVELVNMKPGTRPFRSVCGADFGVRDLNAACEPFNQGIIEAMGLTEFTTLRTD